MIDRKKKRVCFDWLSQLSRAVAKTGKRFHVISIALAHLTGGNTKRPHSVLAPMWFISPMSVICTFLYNFAVIVFVFSAGADAL